MPNHSLNVFSLLSMSDIGTLLKATKSSSPLDPFHLSLLHEITESLTIPLNNIFCESLESGTFPTSYKHAFITPLLKKPNFDKLRASTIIAQSQICRYFPKICNESSRNNYRLI